MAEQVVFITDDRVLAHGPAAGFRERSAEPRVRRFLETSLHHA